MPFTARFNPFSALSGAADGQASRIARAVGLPVPKPWRVVTYLVDGELTSAWETACSDSEAELLEHLRKVGAVKIGELSYKAPPMGNSWKWSQHQIRRIERGNYEGETVLIHIDGAGNETCLENPEVDTAVIKKRKVLLRVQPYFHFS